jgi:hypothetical protein
MAEPQRNGWRDRQFLIGLIALGLLVATFLVVAGVVQGPISSVYASLEEHRAATKAIAAAVERQTSVLRLICRNTTYEAAIKQECDRL